MHPVLFRVGPLTLHTYGLLVAIGVLLGLWLARRRRRARVSIPTASGTWASTWCWRPWWEPSCGWYWRTGATIGSTHARFLGSAHYFQEAPTTAAFSRRWWWLCSTRGASASSFFRSATFMPPRWRWATPSAGWAALLRAAATAKRLRCPGPLPSLILTLACRWARRCAFPCIPPSSTNPPRSC